jgi:hypothetical protein
VNSALNDLVYVVLPGKPPASYQYIELYNHVFRFWKAFWSKVLTDVGADHGARADDFQRQELVCALLHGRDVVGLHTHTFFDLAQDPAREHSYFERLFTPAYIAALRDRRVRSVMTLEYLSVLPGWQSTSLGVSLSRALVALALRQAQLFSVEAAVAAPRCDLSVDRLAAELGAERVLPEDGLVHGRPTARMAFFPGQFRDPRDPRVQRLVESLWSMRFDFTQPEGDRILRSVA